MAPYEPPHQDLPCLPIPLFLSLVLRELTKECILDSHPVFLEMPLRLIWLYFVVNGMFRYFYDILFFRSFFFFFLQDSSTFDGGLFNAFLSFAFCFTFRFTIVPLSALSETAKFGL